MVTYREGEALQVALPFLESDGTENPVGFNRCCNSGQANNSGKYEFDLGFIYFFFRKKLV